VPVPGDRHRACDGRRPRRERIESGKGKGTGKGTFTDQESPRGATIRTPASARDASTTLVPGASGALAAVRGIVSGS
jgi:hypothetical protein